MLLLQKGLFIIKPVWILFKCPFCFSCRFVFVQLADIRKEVQCPICLGMFCFEHCEMKKIIFRTYMLVCVST
jgi:hypothetical protein